MKKGDLVKTHNNDLGHVVEYAGADDHEPNMGWWLVTTSTGTTWHYEGTLEVINEGR